MKSSYCLLAATHSSINDGVGVDDDAFARDFAALALVSLSDFIVSVVAEACFLAVEEDDVEEEDETFAVLVDGLGIRLGGGGVGAMIADDVVVFVVATFVFEVDDEEEDEDEDEVEESATTAAAAADARVVRGGIPRLGMMGNGL
jgi:hypothetical protein